MDTYESRMAGTFSELLLRREDELKRALAALGDDNEPAATHEVSDFKDMALRNTDAEVDDLQAARLEKSLQQLAAARGRLMAGQYGMCLDCSEPIDLRRLQALPEAELCTACQGAREGRHA